MKKTVFVIIFSMFITGNAFSQVKEGLPPSYRLDQANKMEIYRAPAERINHLVHTKLDLKFDYQKEEVKGEAWITLKPHFYDTDKLILDAKGMLIHEVEMITGNAKKKLNFNNDDWKLFIDLDKTYNRSQEYTIYIKYTARPNEVKQEGGTAVTDAKGVYFINPRGEVPNKPTQIWTQGEPTSSSCWFPTIDSPNQKTSQEIYLTVEDKYVTLSNGTLEKQTKNGDGTRTDYWNFPKKHAPYLFFFGIGDFAVVKDKWKGKEVNYYVDHEYEPYAREIFGNTPEMMQFFSDKLNYNYPWENYEQMTARDYVSGAMENTTATLHDEKSQQKPGQLIDENRWEGVIAHELFHHWFGDLVTMKSFGNITVNESFANYSEYLWWEYKYGKEKAEEDRYDDLQGYKMDPANLTKNLVRVHYKDKDDIFDLVSYNKGGKGVLHMLRHYLGDDAFYAGLHNYLKQHEYGTGEPAQLRIALEDASGRDLNWFFDQWYFSDGHPELNIGYDYNAASNKVKVTLIQTQSKLFEFPIVFDVVVNGKITRHEVWAAKKKENIFEFPAASKPEVVIPNADQVLLTDIQDNKSLDEFIAQYRYGKGEFATRLLALEKLSDAQATEEKALNTLISAMDDPYAGIRVRAINLLDEKASNVKNNATDKLKELAKSDSKTLVQAAALNKLNEMDEFDISIFEKGLSSQSYSVQAAAASGVLRLDSSRIDELSKLDDEVINASPKLVGNLMDSWIENDDISKLGIAAEHSAFYMLTQFEDPLLGSQLERGFQWVMSKDDLASTQKVAQTYKQIYRYYGKDNPNVGQIIGMLVDKAIQLKTKTFGENGSPGLEKQIELLNNVKKSMK